MRLFILVVGGPRKSQSKIDEAVEGCASVITEAEFISMCERNGVAED